MGYNSESKEEIKDRMIRTALDYWNIKKVENLDPLVRLLIEALAMQLHDISDEIADIEVRAMKRMSEVLLPEVLTVVHPSHAVVHVEPGREEVKTSLLDGFSTVATMMGRREGRNYSFYPVCETTLRKGNVRMLVVENSVYEVLPDQNKRLVLKKPTSPENVNKVFVGLEFENKNVDLHNLSIYFDFPNIDRRNNYLHYLSSAVWRWKGDEIKVRRGLQTDDEVRQNHLHKFFGGLDSSNSVNESIVDYYRKSYVTIDTTLKVTSEDYSKIPSGLKMHDSDYSVVFNKDLIWIEIDMPPVFTSSVLADIQVSINTFPVANKELRKINYMVKKDFGVIPLTVNDRESFFDLLEVTDEYGTVYNKANGYKEENSEKSYTIRQGGCESFDKRDARNLSHYLFVEPEKEKTYFYLRYWTSYGPLANGMRIGQKLNPLGNAYGEYEHPVFLTSTMGGKNPPSESERIAKFKYVLSSRNRIVTNNDIKNFCFSECCEEISDVEIRKGISRSMDSGCGLQRTIDVYLILKDKEMSEDQKAELSNDMRERLVSQSPMTFNYRVFCSCSKNEDC
ncbi:MAG: type VI secretion system baseplate subunit TssF [Bacteroidales bacterium]|nr:type VI secretion system baseplate subunit TssF [Candidatus Scybalocola fimicaballi]